LSNGVYALIGVVIGGFLSVGLEIGTQTWRDRRVLKAASRLLLVDVRLINALAGTSLEAGRVAFPPSEVARIERTWTTYSELLAREMTPDQWHHVAQPFLVLPLFVLSHEGEVEGTTRTQIETLLKDTAKATSVLEQHAKLANKTPASKP
jgi:hypothetical protein